MVIISTEMVNFYVSKHIPVCAVGDIDNSVIGETKASVIFSVEHIGKVAMV